MAAAKKDLGASNMHGSKAHKLARTAESVSCRPYGSNLARDGSKVPTANLFLASKPTLPANSWNKSLTTRPSETRLARQDGRISPLSKPLQRKRITTKSATEAAVLER